MDKHVIAHRGFWAGLPHTQNTFSSISSAIRKGYEVEIDLRLAKNGNIYISHDRVEEGEKFWLTDLLECYSEYPYLFDNVYFLHVKDNPNRMRGPLKKILEKYTKIKFVIFGVNQYIEKYVKDFGESSIAYEWETSVRGSFLGALVTKASNVWLAPTGRDFTFESIKSLSKKRSLFLVASDVYNRPHSKPIYWNFVSGVCTDVPQIYKKNHFKLIKQND